MYYFVQVLGYTIKYTAEEGRLPLVFVPSEKFMKFLLFPFMNDGQDPVIECLILPHCPLWKNDQLNFDVLVLLLLLSGGDCTERMTLVEYPGISTPRSSSVVDNILTVDQMTALENQRLQREKEDLEAKLAWNCFIPRQEVIGIQYVT